MRLLPDDITTIDAHYICVHRVAVYLIREGDRAAIVDTGTSLNVPYLLAALEEQGMTPDQVDYLIPTHVHLDHAGGAAALLRQCPNATVLAHPKCARHLIAPERLVAGAKMVYGEDLYTQLYGKILPLPEARVRVVQDGETLRWGGRDLYFFNTLGHATHHFVIHDRARNVLFTGDSFGIGRSEISRPGASFMACACAPPDFDAPEARKSVQRILETGADFACLAHYGPVDDLEKSGEQLLRSINAMESVQHAAAKTDLDGDALNSFCRDRIAAAMKDQLEWCGVADIGDDLEWLQGDIHLNAQGVAMEAKKQRAQGAG